MNIRLDNTIRIEQTHGTRLNGLVRAPYAFMPVPMHPST